MFQRIKKHSVACMISFTPTFILLFLTLGITWYTLKNGTDSEACLERSSKHRSY